MAKDDKKKDDNGKKKDDNGKKDKKEDAAKNDKPNGKVRLQELTALSNIDAKQEDDRTAVWVKTWHLAYEMELRKLQVELMKLQQTMKENGSRILLIFEGRDAAGKGGTIKRFIAHLNPRNTRVVALVKPNETESTQWYFQRYINHLPSAGEMVFFDRSWYNRAMVEPVMGFCTDEQNKRFLKDVPLLEELIVKDGIKLFKFYFSVSRDVQNERFEARKKDILKQYKLSPVDNLAQQYWDQYSLRKFQMLQETNRTIAPWTIVRSDNKKLARLNCMKHVLSQLNYIGKISEEELATDPAIIISGIDELRHMEEHLMEPDKLYG
ncbi:polyphosphate kinase 2 [Desulfofustis glycolicus]|uniref:ADP/GDP-polyphosphate phosphotransferase n=1 Tax=Desulfofustis glycolicus DSM 9705 TaxID=1121409 RepID=A0A1M5W8T2_9BACT|nr:polyphosphate kinase 2 [Desulfofustis glycolicus]MCB2217313.1 polyphosphate kinase 2 [Desulfobulbaceae bacterium]SHH83593.1 polyphosphate kinase 2, PA0141 family [Desulfofustis glycolicus DSM 9705]